MKRPINLCTANGTILAEDETEIYIHELDITVTAVVLDNTEAVLSLGKLVRENKFRHVWDPDEVPYLQRGKIY